MPWRLRWRTPKDRHRSRSTSLSPSSSSQASRRYSRVTHAEQSRDRTRRTRDSRAALAEDRAGSLQPHDWGMKQPKEPPGDPIGEKDASKPRGKRQTQHRAAYLSYGPDLDCKAGRVG